MPFDDEYSPADPEVTTTLLRHVLKAWGREHGVTDAALPGLVRDVIDFATASLKDARA